MERYKLMTIEIVNTHDLDSDHDFNQYYDYRVQNYFDYKFHLLLKLRISIAIERFYETPSIQTLNCDAVHSTYRYMYIQDKVRIQKSTPP